MPRLSNTERYLVGLCATFAGAAVSELTGSMLPLALGAAWTLIVTIDVVRRIRTPSHRN